MSDIKWKQFELMLDRDHKPIPTMIQKMEYVKPGMRIGNVDGASVLHIAEIVSIVEYDAEYDEIAVTVKNAITEHGDKSERTDWSINRITKIEDI